jgi:hypothetical protein
MGDDPGREQHLAWSWRGTTVPGVAAVLARRRKLRDGIAMKERSTVTSGRSAATAALIACTLVPCMTYARGKTVLRLPAGGQVVSKSEKQVRSKACRATRRWIELESTPVPQVASIINSRIRKHITVGRKLRDADCPRPGDEERYEYSNTVELTGVWRRFIGTQTSVCFPGGSGRCAMTCEVFDLQNGRRDDLKNHLEGGARADLDTLLTKQAEKDEFPAGYLPLKATDAAICLANDGIHLIAMNDSGSALTTLVIGPSQITRYFRLSPEMVKDLPKK